MEETGLDVKGKLPETTETQRSTSTGKAGGRALGQGLDHLVALREELKIKDFLCLRRFVHRRRTYCASPGPLTNPGGAFFRSDSDASEALLLAESPAKRACREEQNTAK